MKIEVHAARDIREGSWLNEPRYAWFRRAYALASRQTHGISGCAKLDPTETFWLMRFALESAGVDVDALENDADKTGAKR